MIYTPQTNGVIALLRAGAQVDTLDANGMTALHVAASNSSATVFNLLIRHSAFVDSPRSHDGRTALHFAAAAHLGDVTNRIALLLEAGADPSAQDKQGWTPLHLATQQNSPEAAKVLLEHGASLNVTNAAGQRPFDLLRVPTNEFFAPTGPRGSGF